MNAVAQPETPLTTIRGRVTKLYFSGMGLTAGVVECQGVNTRFAGPCPVKEDDLVELHGRFETSKFGLQFKVLKAQPDLKLDAQGLVRFLAASKKFWGIGATRAREIVTRFGEDFDRVVVETPQRLTEIRGITPEIAQGVREEWLRRREQANAITILSGYGLTPYQVDKLIDAFGDSAVRVVQDNPYILMEKVDGFGFRKADEVALKAGTAKANPNRLRAGLLFTMKKVLEEGSTCLPKSEFLQQALALLVLDGDDARGLVNGALDHLRDAKEMVVFESQGTEPQVALESMHRMELHIATVFQKWGCRHA